MRKLFASLLCYSLTLPLLLAAENAPSSEKKSSPSQKKITRRDLANASQEKKAPAKNGSVNEEKKSSSPQKEPQKEKQASTPTQKRWIVTNDPPATTPPPKKKPYPYYPPAPAATTTPAATSTATPKTGAAASSRDETENTCPSDPSSFRVTLKHREANGIGYNDGYSSLDVFFNFSTINNTVRPFFDIRAHITNAGKPAANVGFGVRVLPSYWNVVFGGNAFFDFRQARHSTFEQLGGGIEILGAYWNFHANCYFPIIHTSHLIDTEFAYFSQHNAFFHLEREIALHGVDANIGRTLFQRNYFDISANLGGYYFLGDDHKKATGGFLRFTSNLSRFITLEIQGSYDTLFKGIFQGAAAFNIPFGKRVKTGHKKLGCDKEIALASRLVEPVDRFEMIVSSLHQSTQVALDPRTNQPLYIVFVNNNNLGGAGTAQNPYGTLASAAANSSPGNMIYVLPGNGTSSGMNTGITLQNSQWLQGSGVGFAIALKDGQRAFVPAQTTTSPTLQNATVGANQVVLLQNNNIVDGFAIDATSTVPNGIKGNGITNATITNNHLVNATNADIEFLDSSGSLNITGNLSFSGGATGLGIAASTNFTANISGNTFNNIGTSNIVLSMSGTSKSSITLNNNIIENSTDGAIITLSDSSTMDTLIENNTIVAISTTTGGALGINISDTSSLTASIVNNYFNNATTGLLTISNDTSSANYYIKGNILIDKSVATSAGLILATFDTSTTNALLQNNSSGNAPNVGYFFDNAGGTLLLQSSNSALSGVKAANNGAIQTSGTITYIPISSD